MDEELRDSLMEWYLRYGESVVNVDNSYLSGGENYSMQAAFNSVFIKHKRREKGKVGFCITHEGIEALKNG